ncbi:MAG: hypothetical protein NUW21_11975 [Elusimicrobia bacterium]|nr:hypothetical protein [Elusimicrobiota bacterium]
MSMLKMMTAGKRGLLASVIVFAAQAAAHAQARGPLDALTSPRDSAAYSFEAVPGGPGGPAITDQSLQGTLLLTRERKQERQWSAGARAGRFETERPVALPSGRGEIPHLLWTLEAGLGYHRRLGERRAWGGRVSVGSASDRPFDSIQEAEFRAAAFYTAPSKESNAWLFFLNYSNNSTFLNGVPFPGLAYSWRRPKEGWQVTAGFPFIAASYQPDADWSLRASLFGAVNFDVEAERRAWRDLKLYAAFQRRPRQWLRADRRESRDRLVYDSMEARLGLRCPVVEIADVDLSAGRSFNRRFFEARDASRSPSERTAFGPAWIFKAALTARIGGTGAHAGAR